MTPQQFIATIEADAMRCAPESAASIIQWLTLPDRCCPRAEGDPDTDATHRAFLIIATPLSAGPHLRATGLCACPAVRCGPVGQTFSNRSVGRPGDIPTTTLHHPHNIPG